ncbi:MAG: hypothetical protein IPO44_18120 [Candidatus Microthrix sp.]|nr:hypothetical protein [Candidatus Microthrix sp.]MBK9561391.1 hypothetical protein [Candidatus Microthrix sp.]
MATVDIDDTVEMIGGFGTITDERFRQVQRVHGKLVASWLCQGMTPPTSSLSTGFRPIRTETQDPAILRLAYDRAEALRPGLPPVRWTYDTSEVTGEQIAADVAGSLME